MKKILTAVALSIALPALAHAQTAPVSAPKADCCEKMKAEGKECCCKDMMAKMHGKQAGQPGQPEQHQNHKQ